jgi:AraC-like DNA-binding protein
MRRGDDPAHPHVVFQATLAGAGSFERGPRRWPVGEGMAFFAVLPSRHVYRLPEDSPEWGFFWLNFGHPWVVERITALAERHPAVVPLPDESKLMAASRSLFERVCAGRFEDGIAEEGAALEWLLEFERHLYELAHPRGRRELMMAEVRAYALANLGRSFGVEELARRHGMSRSHFSHQFRAATGVAPAAQVLDVRLAEVRRRLRETGLPLKDIAGETGFADANHLCKAFRRAFHLSPGMFRRQVR